MKLQPASRKEVKRMAVDCGICAVIEIAAFLVLHLFGIGKFSYRMILGAVGGTLIAIGNFAMMCLMVQNATGIQDQKLLKAKVQGSYNLRLLIQGIWIVAAFLIPHINVITAVIPLLFPTIIIHYLQIKGKLMPAGEKPAGPAAPREPADDSEESEDDLNSFEV